MDTVASMDGLCGEATSYAKLGRVFLTCVQDDLPSFESRLVVSSIRDGSRREM